MTRPQHRERKVARARELREQGWGYAQIGRELGHTGSCVQKWLKPEAREWARRSEARPERKAAKLAWGRAKDRSLEGRKPCPECGEPMGVGSARKPTERCRSCIQRQHHERGQALERFWRAGLSIPAIAERMGLSVGSVHQDLNGFRAEGYDLPYRYTTGKRAGRKYRAGSRVSSQLPLSARLGSLAREASTRELAERRAA